MSFLQKYGDYNNTNIHSDKSPDAYTRQTGSWSQNRMSPHISGYWYLLLDPPKLLVNDKNNINNHSNYVKYFSACAESFTPPSRSIVKQEIVGFSGIKKYIISGQEMTNSFGITFREHDNMNIFSMLSHWASAVNPFTGAITRVYKGHCIVILAKPTFSKTNSDNNNNECATLTKSDIDEIFYFDGVFPESQPIDKFNSDIATNESKTIDINFNFDGGFMNKIWNISENADDNVGRFLNEFTDKILWNKFRKPSIDRPIPNIRIPDEFITVGGF